MALGLQIFVIYSIIFFLKDFKILNVKVVQNYKSKFGAERVNRVCNLCICSALQVRKLEAYLTRLKVILCFNFTILHFRTMT